MNIFKKYRTERNVSLAEVCDNLKYSRRVIEAIEDNKVDFMDSPYNYHCVKNYSKFLGFKIPNEIINKYK